MRIRSVGAAVLVAVSVASVIVAGAGSTAGARENSKQGSTGTVRTPTVTGPVTGGKAISDVGTSLYDLASVGYEREEFFIEGEATAYEPVGTLKTDGKWNVAESEQAPYKSRVVVVKPSDPAKFNGTVFVEWYNVTGGFDAPVTWIMTHNQMLREGAIWVGVTAQAAGVVGNGQAAQSSLVEIPQGGLVGTDPARYGTLHHPGDAFSYDIFSQGGVAVKGDGTGPDPLEGYDVKRVIAVGESQSAGRITTYVNAVAPIAHVYDGYLIQSRRSNPAPLGAQVLGTVVPGIPVGTRTRTDIDVPVLNFATETDVEVPLRQYADARQPDSKNFRSWEVAGTSHADAYTGVPAVTDLGQGKAEAFLLDPANASGGSQNCATPVNAGGQHVVAIAALTQLERWVRDGTPPRHSPRLKTTGTGDAIKIVRDEHGIAVGGIRTPLVDAPIATNDGLANSGATSSCEAFGHTKPFDAATLAALYPKGSAEWVKKFDAAADTAVKEGVWPKPEAEHFKAAASQITFG